MTTIPAPSNVGVATAYGDWGRRGGAAAQLGLLTLFIQRRYYVMRRRKHLQDPSRAAAGLPVGRSRHTRRGSR